MGSGWYGFYLDLRESKRQIEAIAGIVGAGERPAALGPLEFSVTRTRHSYAELGRGSCG